MIQAPRAAVGETRGYHQHAADDAVVAGARPVGGIGRNGRLCLIVERGAAHELLIRRDGKLTQVGRVSPKVSALVARYVAETGKMPEVVS